LSSLILGYHCYVLRGGLPIASLFFCLSEKFYLYLLIIKNTYTMKNYESYFWKQMSDDDLHKIVRSNEYLRAYQLRAMEELNNRAINYPIK